MVNQTGSKIRIGLVFVGLSACAPDLETGIEVPLEEAEFAEGEAQIDATSETEWVGFDLDAETVSEQGWDIGFQRFKVRLNPDLGVQAAVAPGMDGGLMELEWSVDDETDPEEPFYVFNDVEDGWFDYNLQGHVLTPKDRDYVVRTSEDNIFQVRILYYYDDAGTSAIIRFDYTQIDGEKSP